MHNLCPRGPNDSRESPCPDNDTDHPGHQTPRISGHSRYPELLKPNLNIEGAGFFRQLALLGNDEEGFNASPSQGLDRLK